MLGAIKRILGHFAALVSPAVVLLLIGVQVAFGLRGFDHPSDDMVYLIEVPGVVLGWGGVALFVPLLTWMIMDWWGYRVTGLATKGLGTCVLAVAIGALLGVGGGVAHGGVVGAGLAEVLTPTLGKAGVVVLLLVLAGPAAVLALSLSRLPMAPARVGRSGAGRRWPLPSLGFFKRLGRGASDESRPWYPERRYDERGNELPVQFGQDAGVSSVRFADETMQGTPPDVTARDVPQAATEAVVQPATAESVPPPAGLSQSEPTEELPAFRVGQLDEAVDHMDESFDRALDAAFADDEPEPEPEPEDDDQASDGAEEDAVVASGEGDAGVDDEPAEAPEACEEAVEEEAAASEGRADVPSDAPAAQEAEDAEPEDLEHENPEHENPEHENPEQGGDPEYDGAEEEPEAGELAPAAASAPDWDDDERLPTIPELLSGNYESRFDEAEEEDPSGGALDDYDVDHEPAAAAGAETPVQEQEYEEDDDYDGPIHVDSEGRIVRAPRVASIPDSEFEFDSEDDDFAQAPGAQPPRQPGASDFAFLTAPAPNVEHDALPPGVRYADEPAEPAEDELALVGAAWSNGTAAVEVEEHAPPPAAAPRVRHGLSPAIQEAVRGPSRVAHQPSHHGDIDSLRETLRDSFQSNASGDLYLAKLEAIGMFDEVLPEQAARATPRTQARSGAAARGRATVKGTARRKASRTKTRAAQPARSPTRRASTPASRGGASTKKAAAKKKAKTTAARKVAKKKAARKKAAKKKAAKKKAAAKRVAKKKVARKRSR